MKALITIDLVNCDLVRSGASYGPGSHYSDPRGHNYWYKDVKLIYGYMANLKCQWLLLSVIIGFSYGKETIYLNFQEERSFLLIYVGFQYAIVFFKLFWETPSCILL